MTPRQAAVPDRPDNALRRSLRHSVALSALSVVALGLAALLLAGGTHFAPDYCLQVGGVREGETVAVVDYGTTCLISSPPRLGGGERRVPISGATGGLALAAGALLLSAYAGVAAFLVARRRAVVRTRSGKRGVGTREA